MTKYVFAICAPEYHDEPVDTSDDLIDTIKPHFSPDNPHWSLWDEDINAAYWIFEAPDDEWALHKGRSLAFSSSWSAADTVSALVALEEMLA